MQTRVLLNGVSAVQAVSRPAFRLTKLTCRAPFSSSTVWRSGKEDALHEENRASEVDRLKKQSINKKEWQEGLASNSESALKADKENVNDTKEHIEKLQKETEKKTQEGL